jgi:hypothetical protein
MLRTSLTDAAWFKDASRARDVFGDGTTGERITDILFGARSIAQVEPMRLAA